MVRTLALLTKPAFLRWRLRLGDLFVNFLRLNAFGRLIKPDFVFLKRFLAVELVFIFGIRITLYYLCSIF